MGGYGAYVWSAFGLTLILLGGLLLQSWLWGRKRTRELASARDQIGPRAAARPRPVVAQRIEGHQTLDLPAKPSP
jgi:heme exporter protein CcmD